MKMLVSNSHQRLGHSLQADLAAPFMKEKVGELLRKQHNGLVGLSEDGAAHSYLLNRVE